MEAHEALIIGVLGLATLFAWQRRRDPADKWLALGVLWICLTGSLGLVLAQFGEPFNYVRLFIRFTGPPILLFVVEESIWNGKKGKSNRRANIIFASVLWVVSMGLHFYLTEYPQGDVDLNRAEPPFEYLADLLIWAGISSKFGITAWMLLLAICYLAALFTILPAAFKKINPGFGGIAAFLILSSESLASLDPRWSSGQVSLGIDVTYRTLLTLFLAAIALVKANVDGLKWMSSTLSLRESKTKGTSKPRKTEEEKPADKKDKPSEPKPKPKGKKPSKKGSKSKKKR